MVVNQVREGGAKPVVGTSLRIASDWSAQNGSFLDESHRLLNCWDSKPRRVSKIAELRIAFSKLPVKVAGKLFVPQRSPPLTLY